MDQIDKKVERLAVSIAKMDKPEIVTSLYEYTDEVINIALEISRTSIEEEVKNRIMSEVMIAMADMKEKIIEEAKSEIKNAEIDKYGTFLDI